jgi:hypothetical protein
MVRTYERQLPKLSVAGSKFFGPSIEYWGFVGLNQKATIALRHWEASTECE